jgi:hypothetical protein
MQKNLMKQDGVDYLGAKLIGEKVQMKQLL